MGIVHQSAVHKPDALACAQAGCAACLNHLICRHEGLVHAVLQQTHRCGVPYVDLIQEGRIALWRAVAGFDRQRGTGFSTYAWAAIQRRVQRYIARDTRPQGVLRLGRPVDVDAQVLDQIWRDQLAGVIRQTLANLPSRQRRVLMAAYGLDGEPPRSLAAIGRQMGLSGERVRQLRNDALVLLRLPAVAPALHRWQDGITRTDYARLQALNRAWLRQQRGRGSA